MVATTDEGCNNSKDLCEHIRGSEDTKGEDTELIVRVSHHEMEELLMSQEDVYVKAYILHIESHELGPMGEGLDNEKEHDYPESELVNEFVQ